MHLFGAGVAKHFCNDNAIGAADDGIIHQKDAFAFHLAAQYAQFQTNSHFARALARLNKGAADITIFHQDVSIRNAAGIRIPLRGRERGIWYACDDIRLHRRNLREQLTGTEAGFVDRNSIDC